MKNELNAFGPSTEELVPPKIGRTERRKEGGKKVEKKTQGRERKKRKRGKKARREGGMGERQRTKKGKKKRKKQATN